MEPTEHRTDPNAIFPNHNVDGTKGDEELVGSVGNIEGNPEKLEFFERLRLEGEPFETKISAELLKFLESAFSENFEKAFLLFSKDGVICKAVESTEPNSPKSFGFKKPQMVEVVNIMKKEGYEYIGTYHHHLDSDQQINNRINPAKELEHYRLPASYDPIHLSPDDREAFTYVGFPLADQDDPKVQELVSGVKYLFLGHKSQSKKFRIKCYTNISKLPDTHPWNQHKEELRKFGGFLNHYYPGIVDILDHPIIPTSSEDDDVEATKILDSNSVKNRKHENKFNNVAFGNGIIRIFTTDGKISMLELVVENNTKRYYYDNNGLLTHIVDYGDNTTRTIVTNIKSNTENLVEEQQKIEDSFREIFDKIKQ